MEQPIQEGEAGDVHLRVLLKKPGHRVAASGPPPTPLHNLPVFVDLSDSDSKERLMKGSPQTPENPLDCSGAV